MVLPRKGRHKTHAVSISAGELRRGLLIKELYMLKSYTVLTTGVLILTLVCARTPAFGNETSEPTESEKKVEDTTHSPDDRKGGVSETQAVDETPKEEHAKGSIVLRKPNKCPDCGSIRIARIMYGLPDFSSEELKKDVEEGRIVLGGCIIAPDSPRWQCKGCGARMGTRYTKPSPVPSPSRK
jgi:ribosomal protein L37AE/L43A